MTERPDPLAEPEGYGSKLGRLEHLTKRMQQVDPPDVVHGLGRARTELVAALDPGEPVVDGLCGWYEPTGDHARCTEPREWVLALGDMAEHVASQDLCTRHLTIVARLPRFWCTICKQDMRLAKVGKVVDGEVAWLDETEWPGRLKRPALPPEQLF